MDEPSNITHCDRLVCIYDVEGFNFYDQLCRFCDDPKTAG